MVFGRQAFILHQMLVNAEAIIKSESGSSVIPTTNDITYQQ